MCGATIQLNMPFHLPSVFGRDEEYVWITPKRPAATTGQCTLLLDEKVHELVAKRALTTASRDLQTGMTCPCAAELYLI